MSFLESLLPTQGLYCVVGISATNGPRHYWCETRDQIDKYLELIDRSDSQAYIAQASFKAGTTSRSAVNAAYFRNFFLDIDCGEGKPYATQKDGVLALVEFCKVSKLPLPSVVNSGNGLYAQWRLEADMPALLWHSAAVKLKKVTEHYGFYADPACTADMARILRPVGMHNKKNGFKKPVKLVSSADVFNTFKLVTQIQNAFVATGEKLPAPRHVKPENNFLAGIYDDVPSSALQIAEKCAQIAHIKAIKGNVAEPYWYAVVGLLRYTVESPEIVHEWSMGHTEYSAAETDRKIAQHLKANIGPTTCAKLSGENPELCKGCPFVGKITTPLVLGRAEPKALAKTEMDYPEPPKPFRITESGVVAMHEGEAITVYRYPLWVSAINHDYFGESITFTHKMPFTGVYKDVTIASNKITEPKTFFAALLDEHIHIIGKEQKGAFLMYTEKFMDQLRAKQHVAKLSGQMGWTVQDSGELSFIHGSEIYHRGGVVQKVGYSSSAPEFVRVLRQVGDVEKWAEVTKILNRPGLEPLAFGFLCAAFGSPLVRFSGYEGVMVSEVGGSGLGKTLVGRLGLSAWGESRALMLDPDDTKNALAGRFGVYNNLPAYIDEISNIEALPLSDLAYKITRGRDKLRMTRNAVERSNTNQWSLIGLVSSNHSLVEKLSNLKGDAGAEVNRIFEFDITGGITAEEGKLIYDALQNNYGVAGKIYAQYLVEKQEVLTPNLHKISNMFAKDCESLPEERFWTMTGAVAMYGGLIAQELGICHIDVKRLRPWIIEAVKTMRGFKNDNTFDPISFLGTLLDRHSQSTVVVESWNPDDPRIQPALKEPRQHLVARHELKDERLWISYDTIKFELHRIHISSKKLAAALKERGLMVGSGRIILGRGTLHGSISQLCWEFDLRHPELVKLRQAAMIAAKQRS